MEIANHGCRCPRVGIVHMDTCTRRLRYRPTLQLFRYWQQDAIQKMLAIKADRRCEPMPINNSLEVSNTASICLPDKIVNDGFHGSTSGGISSFHLLLLRRGV
jgi:hypothetical protein